jgi:hypothetical protein
MIRKETANAHDAAERKLAAGIQAPWGPDFDGWAQAVLIPEVEMTSYDPVKVQRDCPLIREGVDRNKRIAHYLLPDLRVMEIASPIIRRGKQ